MLSYKQWKLLNESLGSFNLGLSQKQNLGLVSNYFTGNAEVSELEEGGMMPPMHKGKKPFPKPFPSKGGEGMGPDAGLDGDEFDPDAEGDDMDMENPDELGDEEDDELGDEEGDEEIDPDAELDGDEDMDGLDNGEDMGDEDMGMGIPPPHKRGFGKKKPPMMGNPHNAGPFMRFSRRMKAEDCGAEDNGEEENGDKLIPKKKGKNGDEGDVKLSFLQKKSMKKKMSAGNSEAPETKLGKPSLDGKPAPKGDGGVKKGALDKQVYGTGKTKSADGFKKETFKKGCSSGMDKKCDKCKKQKKMKETSYDYYDRPASFDNSEEAFMRSVSGMFGKPNEKFWDGMRDFSEDLLLPPAEPQPGEVGYAPQTRVGSDVNAIGESIEHLMKKIADLEKQLKK